MGLCIYVWQPEACEPLKLELRMVVGHPTWVLGTKIGPSREEASLVTAKLSLQVRKASCVGQQIDGKSVQFSQL